MNICNIFSVKCPEDFIFFSGSDYNACFGIFYNMKTWHEAQTSCIDKGSTLASIHNTAEQDFFASGKFEINIGRKNAVEQTCMCAPKLELIV